MKRVLLVGMMVGALGLAAAPKAEAALIVGTIAFGGDGGPTGSATWFGSTGIDFFNPWGVTQRDGDYASVPLFTLTTFTDFSYGAGSGPMATVIGPLTVWTFTIGPTTYSLSIGTVTNIDRGSVANDNISVQGTGTLTITGSGSFNPTPGTWNFTGGFAGPAQNLSFSSGAAAVVPEPGSMVLLGTGLLGLAAAVRRRIRK